MSKKKLYPIKGSYIVSTEHIHLNPRERKALDVIVKECEREVEEHGYPEVHEYQLYPPKILEYGYPELQPNEEITTISKFIVTKYKWAPLPLFDPIYGSKWKPIYGSRGNVYITFEYIHDKADQLEEENEFSRVLLFPHAIVDYSTLYTACLYFDKVYVVFPDEAVNVSYQDIGVTSVPTKDEPHFFGNGFGGDHRQDVADFVIQVCSFFDRTYPLRREGVLNLISPGSQLSEDFFRNVESDLQDSSFDQTVSLHSSPAFILGCSKGLSRIHAETREGYSPASRLRNFFSNVRKVISETTLGIQDFEESDRIGRRFGEWGFLRVNPQLGASILTNHALLACSNRRLLPLTDNSLFYELLSYKCRKIDRSAQGKAYKRDHSITEALVAREVINEHIPLLHFKSCEDVLEIRERHKDSISNFRNSIRFFASQVQSMPYSRDFYKEIESVIATEINPVVEELRQDMRSIPQKFLQSTFKGLKAGTIPLIAAAFAGLPVPYLLTLSAGTVALEALMDLSLEMKRKPPKTGLCFLLKAK